MSSIPDEAVMAAARSDYGSGDQYGTWETEPDEVREMYLKDARLILEAAAPHMATGVEEFGIFRKGGDWHDAPMEKWTFMTRERAECAIRKFNDGESWLEVRSRIAAPWTATP